MCSTFEVWSADPVRSAATTQTVAPLEIPCVENGAGSFHVGAVRCTLLAVEKLQCEFRLTSMLVSASTACDFLFCSAQTPEPGGLSIERNCPWSAEIESSWVGHRRPRCARANRCCGSSWQPAPSTVERRRRCPPVCSVSRKLVEWKRVYVLVAAHGASRPWVSRAVSGRDVALRR
jgi:hypothetical protein